MIKSAQDTNKSIKFEQVRSESCIQKKKKNNNDEQIHSARTSSKKLLIQCIQELSPHLGCHWLHSGIESLPSIPLAREAATHYIVPAPQDCEVPRRV